ncbi:hypothetical protein SAMN05660841_04085 [Sphingobacterium nematocida]|uniref:Uncharacterized protein n=1 Tax=Sphingobacterium nematocida TaxID=1513896 RepID=A0A1T5GI71_9SPHI|nr:hypothetical protein [Sphingobacterium nematocida]SKC08027.1 hypothetical protein SAMN05660841_04085 [Sphingobacterium nematocida]
MKIKTLTFLFTVFLFYNTSCNSKQNPIDNQESYSDISDNSQGDYSHNDDESDGYEDGTYCAEVEYYNPSTGTRNTYSLDVEVENGELTVIRWPNGGWLDESHFSPEDISSGECEFTSDKGYHYTVTLGDSGGCTYTDDDKVRRDLNNDIQAVTCPKCGDNKDSYNEYCYSCKRQIEDEEENTCSRCGNYEYGVYGGLCSSCRRNDDEM